MEPGVVRRNQNLRIQNEMESQTNFIFCMQKIFNRFTVTKNVGAKKQIGDVKITHSKVNIALKPEIV